jgi:hypothetical protein
MMNEEMMKLEIKETNIVLPSKWLDDLNDEQRTRIELLYEEMIESGFNPERIKYTIEHARAKEIMFAAHVPEG